MLSDLRDQPRSQKPASRVCRQAVPDFLAELAYHANHQVAIRNISSGELATPWLSVHHGFDRGPGFPRNCSWFFHAVARSLAGRAGVWLVSILAHFSSLVVRTYTEGGPS